MPRFTNTGNSVTVASLDAKLEKIEQSFKEMLSRKGEAPNQMQAPLDMSGHSILNLPEPTSPLSAARLKDVQRQVDLVSSNIVVDRQSQNIFNIVDYGAVADNSTDNKQAIDDAIAALAAVGGGCLYIPPAGVFRTSGGHTLTSNMRVEGGGYSSCLKSLNVPEPRPLFVFIEPLRPQIIKENLEFRSVRLEGVFDEDSVEKGTNGTVTVVGFRNISFYDVTFQWINNFGININNCEDVFVSNCYFRYVARDACAIWGTPNVRVDNNSFIGTDDDCISINQAGFESTNDVMRDGIIISNNYMRDTGSINVQQAKNCIVSNNVLRLCKGGVGIMVEGVSFSEARDGNSHTVIIENNLIVDLLDRLLSTRPNPGALSSNLRVAIVITQKSYTTTELNNPYEFHYSDSGAGNELPVNQNSGIVVRGNIIRRTVIGASQQYSDFGYGKMFSRFQGSSTAAIAGTDPSYFVNGFVDPLLEESNFRCRSLEIRDCLVNSVIENNLFQGSADRAVFFNTFAMSAANFRFQNLFIKNNIFRNFRKVGIDLSDYEGTEQDIKIEDNVFDGDPYFAVAGHNADGSWVSQGNCIGVKISLVKGISIIENTFKNLSSPFLIGSSNTESNILDRNTYVGEPSTSASPRDFQITNKGLGLFPWDTDPEGELDYVDSDPTSPTYLEKLPKQLKAVSADLPPTNGYYFLGQTVLSRRSVVDTGKIILGFRRITDGNTHVNGTDWQPIYGTIT